MKKSITKFYLIATVFALFLSSCGSGTPEKRTSITEHEAKLVAEGQVETLIKSPSTADFSGLGETSIEPIKDGYNVTGYVDSQNSFGAIIRSNYSVDIYLDKTSGEIMYKNLDLK